MIRLTLAVALVACGGGSSAKDAPMNATVQTVSCTGITPAATVTTNATGTAYMPAATTITQGQVVEFQMPMLHNVTSATPGLAVDFGHTVCLMFTAPTTYSFKCSVHLFTGTITVQ
jgi:plastocyanin